MRKKPLKAIPQLVTALVLAGTSVIAQAEVKCHNTDLRSNPVLGSIRNQGPLGWCFAYAAADLYSVALNRRLSPFDIATNYYRDHRDYKGKLTRLTQWGGGRQDFVYQSVQRWGICPDNVISAYLPEAPHALKKIEEIGHALMGLTGNERRDRATALLYPKYSQLYYVFPQTPAPRLRDALVSMDPHDEPLIALSDEICRDRRVDVPQSLKREALGRPSPEQTLEFLNRNLHFGRPVAIAYDTKSLKDPFADRKALSVGHISTIVASRKSGDQCEYLLRNTWGPFNAKLHSPLLSKWRDGEYLWIPQQMATNMALELHSIRR